MMDLGHDCPELLVRCCAQDCTLGQFAERAHTYLSELLALHPVFSNLRLVGKNMRDSPPLENDLSNLRDWIDRRSWWKKMPTGMEYTHCDAKGYPTARSTGGMGFKVGVANLKEWDDKVSINLEAGLNEVTTNNCNITLPRKNHPEFQQRPFMRDLLELIVNHWPVSYASVANGGWNNAVNWTEEPPPPPDQIEIGWLTYVADPTIAEGLPPGIAAHRLGPGVVFQLTEHFTSYKNPDDVALGLRVKQALAAAGRLRMPSKPS
jgi:hypothetical protein